MPLLQATERQREALAKRVIPRPKPPTLIAVVPPEPLPPTPAKPPPKPPMVAAPKPRDAERTKRRREAAKTLRTMFACFSGPHCQPLKIGISRDLIERAPEIAPDDISGALAMYVGLPAYLWTCTEGATRIDLDGAPAGVVTAKEAAYVVQRLAMLARRRMAKRKARNNKGGGDVIR
jgi:sRNA-binding protein